MSTSHLKFVYNIYFQDKGASGGVMISKLD